MAAAGSVEITNREEERGQLCRELPSVGSGCGAAVNSNGDCSLRSSAASSPAGNPPCFSEENIGLSVKSFFFFFFAAQLCLEKVYLLLCKKVVRNLLVLHAAALLPRKPPGPGDEASAIFLVSL